MKCPFCWGKAKVTNWEPPKGYDPQMVKYKCPQCGIEFYTRVKKKPEKKEVN